MQAAQAEGGVIYQRVKDLLAWLGCWLPEGGLQCDQQQQYLLNLDWILELAGELAGPFILRQLGCEAANSGEGAPAR